MIDKFTIVLESNERDRAIAIQARTTIEAIVKLANASSIAARVVEINVKEHWVEICRKCGDKEFCMYSTVASFSKLRDGTCTKLGIVRKTN